MPRKLPVPWDEIPDTTVVPDATYLVVIEELKEDRTREAQKVMYKIAGRIVEPALVNGKPTKNMPIYDNFVIGSDADPDAKDAATWKDSIGMKRLKSLVKASGVQQTNDLDFLCEAVRGKEVIALVGHRTMLARPDGTGGGNVLNQVTGYFKPGEREIGSEGRPSVQRVKPSSPVAPIEEEQAPPPPPKKGAKAAAPSGVECPICPEGSALVPRSEFRAHTDGHYEE